MPTSKLMHIANAIQLLQNTLKCVICLEMLREPVSTRCGHHFCNLCLTNHLNHKKNGRATCPLCSIAISRRAIVDNDIIRRQVESVKNLIKALQADTSVDITQFRQTPSSTNEANASVPGPSTNKNHSRKGSVPSAPAHEDSDDREIEDATPKGSPHPKISSAEKVKSWLIQNNNDFESKNILSEFSDPSKPLPHDEDSDSDLVSVSQIAKDPQSNIEPVKHINDCVKIGARPVRRSLKIKEINQLTSKKISKCSDKVLQDDGRASVPKQIDISTVSKTNKASVGRKRVPLSDSKSVSPSSRESTGDMEASVVADITNQDSSLISQLSNNVVSGSNLDKGMKKDSPLHEEMPHKEPSRAVQNPAEQPSKKPSLEPVENQNTLFSDLDSCEIIPPSEYNVDLPILKLRRVEVSSCAAPEKKEEMSTKPSAKMCSDKTSVNPPRKKQSTSPGNGVAFLKAGRFGVSKRCNVRFVQYGRVVRERRFVPSDIRCHCVDKPMFLVDLMESETKISGVAPERHSIGVQTTSFEPSQELCAAEDAAVDAASVDLFPFSPEKIVHSGGEIVRRRSNNSSIVSDGIMDAITVLLSQPTVPQSSTYDKSGNAQLEAEKPVLESPSESLLTKKPIKIMELKTKKAEEGSDSKKATGTSSVESSNSNSEEELVGPAGARKSTKRPRQLSSSEDSESGEQNIGPKKRKKSPLSDSDRMSFHISDEYLPSNSLDQTTLESPQRLVEGIKAKIAAGMLGRGKTDEKIQRRTSPRSSPRTQRISRQPSTLTNIHLSTPLQRKPSSDSDLSDCELLEGTPQQHDSINSSRRSFRYAEEISSVQEMDTTIVPTESNTPGFVDPTQAVFDDLSPSSDSGKKSEVKTSEKNSLDKSVCQTSPEGKRRRVEKIPTPQRPLREKNATEVSTPNKTLNNISEALTKQDRFSEKKNETTPRALQKTPSKAPTPKTPGQIKTKLCFVCSGLPGNLTALVQKLAAQVGADFSGKFDAKTTHLVVRTKDGNTTDKTLKYLCAVAAKKWVVSFQWAVNSIKEGKLLPEEKYEVLDSTGAQGPRLSRLSPKLLFSGFEFCVIPPLSDITKQQLENLLEMCGATVVSDPKKFSFHSDVLPLCLAEWDEEREPDFERWIDRHCVPLVQHEWVLECIGRFSLVSFWTLLMSDVSDDNLRAMGYPPGLIDHPPTDSTSTDVE